MIGEEGASGLLPGATGEWAAKGHLGVEFRIAGITPSHHLTWAMMQNAVAGMQAIMNSGHVAKEARCTMTVAHEVVGIVMVREQVRGDKFDQQ